MKLKQHSLLAYIHPTNLEQLERVSQAITLKKGETLFRQEEIAHSIYFVREGTLKNDPEELIKSRIAYTIEEYTFASHQEELVR